MKIRKSLFPASICMLLVFCPGCWDNRDVTALNFVTAAGLERTEDGHIRIIAEIPKPESVQTQSNKGGGQAEKEVAIYTGTGDTVIEAVRNNLKTINKRMVWTHLKLIIISEDIAREGIMQILDLFERDSEPSITARVVIAKGNKVQQIMNAKSDLEKIPSVHINNLIEVNQKALANTSEIEVIDVIKEISTPGKNCLIPFLQLKQDGDQPNIKDIELPGVGVLKKDKLVGYLTQEESRGWFLTTNKAKSTIFNISHPYDKAKYIAFELDHVQAKKKIQFIDGQARMKVEITAVGDLGETQVSGDFTKPEFIAQIEEEVGKAIQENIQKTVKTAQELQSDIFGFGDIYHKGHVTEWKMIKDRWDEVFSQGSVEVTVKVKLERSGYVTRPLQSQ